MYYIYKMIHKATGRVYIGQRKCPKGKTPDTDTAYNGSGKIWRAIWRKHMDECCKVILDTAPSKTDIDALERKYIAHYKNVMGDYCVNIAPGGEGFLSGEDNPMFGKHHSDEARRKMSEANRGERHPNFGKHRSEETKRKMSDAQRGKHFSEEHKRKISDAMKGKHFSEETKRKLSDVRKGESNPNFGKHFSEESKRKMSEARKAYWKNRKGDIA